MKRRRWLQTVLSAPAALTALPQVALAQTRDDNSTKLEFGSPDLVADKGRRFFSDDEYAALTDLSRKVFPSIDGRPGAIEAHAPEFLDFLISQSPAPRQALYRRGLAAWKAGTQDAAFLEEAKDDILRATFNSREWNTRNGARRGGGSGTYYLPVE
jgi:Gluconate 2-dehydrogenase subunit 3